MAVTVYKGIYQLWPMVRFVIKAEDFNNVIYPSLLPLLKRGLLPLIDPPGSIEDQAFDDYVQKRKQQLASESKLEDTIVA
jgi:hypothetical protein